MLLNSHTAVLAITIHYLCNCEPVPLQAHLGAVHIAEVCIKATVAVCIQYTCMFFQCTLDVCSFCLFASVLCT